MKISSNPVELNHYPKNKDKLSYSDLSASSGVTNLIAAEPQSNYNRVDQWVEVLVDCPGIQGLYTYSLPSDLSVCSGDVVSVPFAIQITGGIAIRILATPPLI